LLRRSIPALLAALVPWVAVRIVVEFVLRPHFMAPLVLAQKCPCSSNGPGNAIVDVPPATGRIGNLIVSHGGIGNTQVTYYQPAGRYWEFQSIEAGIFVALTLAVLAVAVWLMHRRTA
jgi:hypothetical protein